eukprot:4453532-Amphidinium_carterae.1
MNVAPTSTAYLAGLKTCERWSLWQHALHVMDDCNVNQVDIDSAAYHAIMQAACSCSQWRAVLQLLDDSSARS